MILDRRVPRRELVRGLALGGVLGATFLIDRRPSGAEDDRRPGQQEIEEGLTCQCGCGLTVHSCNHLNCSSGIPLKQEVAAEIASGKDRTEILAHFEAKYGEKILSSPTKRGFNLTAWVTPFAAIGVGGLVIAAVLARWRRRTVQAGSELPPVALDDERRARLERELRDFDSRS